MMKKLLIPLMGILVAGCVTNTTLSTGELAKEYLDIWMQKNYPSVTAEASGIYIISDMTSGAAKWSADKAWVLAEVTIKSLSGTVISTDNKEWSQQLGTYKVSSYYGGKFSAVGEGASYAGFDAILNGMEIGATRVAIVPAWLLTTSRYSSEKEYIDNCSASSSLIYIVHLIAQVTDPTEWEKQQVAAYVSAHYPGATATLIPGSEEGSEADGTFWFISDVSGFNEEDKRSETEMDLSLNYTGYRLDGTVFDTSVKNTAIQNEIYNDSRTYEPMKLVYYSKWSDILIDNSSSYVDGFKAGVSLMWWSGQKATVIFTSSHGYSSSGNSDAIPAYCPLAFDLELVPKQ